MTFRTGGPTGTPDYTKRCSDLRSGPLVASGSTARSASPRSWSRRSADRPGVRGKLCCRLREVGRAIQVLLLRPSPDVVRRQHTRQAVQRGWVRNDVLGAIVAALCEEGDANEHEPSVAKFQGSSISTPRRHRRKQHFSQVNSQAGLNRGKGYGQCIDQRMCKQEPQFVLKSRNRTAWPLTPRLQTLPPPSRDPRDRSRGPPSSSRFLPRDINITIFQLPQRRREGDWGVVGGAARPWGMGWGGKGGGRRVVAGGSEFDFGPQKA
jgi:hypothetical protein